MDYMQATLDLQNLLTLQQIQRKKNMATEKMTLREIRDYLNFISANPSLLDEMGTLIIHLEDGDISPNSAEAELQGRT